MEKPLLNQLLASAIALGISVPTPLLLYKDNLGAVLAGLAGGITATTAVTRLVGNRKRNSEDINSSEELQNVPSQDELSQPEVTQKKRKRLRRKNRCHHPVTTWLKSRNIEVISYRKPKETDAVFDRVAEYLGNNYTVLAEIHRCIKRSIETKEEFSYCLLGKNEQEIKLCIQYGEMLYRTVMLSFYDDNSSNNIICGKVIEERSDINQFLNGGWFERFIYQQASQQLTVKDQVECLVNPVLKFPNGDKFELDLLFYFDNQPFWIECKSGNHYKECLPKYCQHREILSLDKERAILVGLELSESRTKDLTALWSITVTNVGNFLEVLKKVS
jgi:hypothetical protein